MDDLDLILTGLAQQAPPQASLDRIRPRVQSVLRHRITGFTLAAGMLLATWQLTGISNRLLNTEIPLPLAGKALIAVPDIVISISPIPPVQLYHRRPKPQPHMLDGNTIQLASTNENIVILWSLE